MLPLADAVKVAPVGSVEALTPTTPAADVRQEAFERSIQRLIGEQLQGEVLTRLKDGTFLVNVAGTTTRMTLPEGAQTGTSIAMTLVSIQPRPTFLLGAETPLSAKLPSSTTQLNAAALNDAPQLYTADKTNAVTEAKTNIAVEAKTNAAPEEAIVIADKNATGPARALVENYIQTASMMRAEQVDTNALTGILQKAEGAAAQLAAKSSASAPASLSTTGQLISHLLRSAQDSNAPTTLLGKTPILPGPTMSPEHVASALHETLSVSGLFYESHVADWAQGKRSMAELMREPQMQANTTSPTPPQHNAAPIDAANNNLAQMINLQLGSLEHQNAQWHGEVWPGQPMEWDVRKDESHDPHDSGDDPQSWQSAVRFNFPMLGSVSATIHLRGEHLQIHINTSTEDAAASLRAHTEVLTEALAAAGTALDSIIVKPGNSS